MTIIIKIFLLVKLNDFSSYFDHFLDKFDQFLIDDTINLIYSINILILQSDPYSIYPVNTNTPIPDKVVVQYRKRLPETPTSDPPIPYVLSGIGAIVQNRKHPV